LGKDTSTSTNTGVVRELLQIVGGSSGFEGARGTISVAGQEIGGIAVYTGEICTLN